MIIATDAEQVPGIGDWGVGGIEIVSIIVKREKSRELNFENIEALVHQSRISQVF